MRLLTCSCFLLGRLSLIALPETCLLFTVKSTLFTPCSRFDSSFSPRCGSCSSCLSPISRSGLRALFLFVLAKVALTSLPTAHCGHFFLFVKPSLSFSAKSAFYSALSSYGLFAPLALCLSTTSGPGPGELSGFWGSMVFRHVPTSWNVSGNNSRGFDIKFD